MDLWIDTNVIIRFLAGDHTEHSAAATHLIALFTTRGMKTESRDMIQALELYRECNIDFEDAYLACLAAKRKVQGVVSFNGRDFRKSGCEHYHPFDLI